MHHHPHLRRLLLASVVTLGLLASVPAAHAQAVASPTYIPFQGLVTNQTGQLVPDGTYSIIFNLYDTAVGGQPIWSERHTKVGVINGQLNVFLGSIPGNSVALPSLDFSTVKYLGITIDTDNVATTADPEMVPRQVVVPSFHAKRAESASNAVKLNGYDWTSILVGASNDPTTALIRGNRIETGGVTSTQIFDGTVGSADLESNAVTTVKIGDSQVTSAKIGDSQVTSAKILDGEITLADIADAVERELMPRGGVIAYGGTTEPTGWLICDGRAVLRTGTYAALFAAIGTAHGSGDGSTTFNLPDYRGRFLRGVSGTSANDPDRLARSTMAPGGNGGNLVGSVQGDELRSHHHRNRGADDTGIPPGMTYIAGGAFGRDFADGVFRGGTAYTGGAETRPVNAYVNYIIKY